MTDNACVWTPDEDYGDVYDGSCGVKWEFMEGGPAENGVKYCPNCGRRILPDQARLDEAPNMTDPNDHQIGGQHYVSLSVQPWGAMQSWMSPEQFEGYLRGNVIKYVARYDKKGGVEDLRKAAHYLDKLIAHITPPSPE